MTGNNQKFTLLLPTKNRLKELKYTLLKIESLLESEDLVCVICDDGSTDGTYEYISKSYPNIQIIKNNFSKGIHHVRNQLLNQVKTPYAISIDDDANFLTEDILKITQEYFVTNDRVGLLSFRSYWSKQTPISTITSENIIRVKSFGAVGFAIRMNAWRSIPNFPAWFVFYGEEEFAAFQLFKMGWEIHYLPEVLVHHRVDIKSRKKDKDYRLRLRRSLRSGWYLYFMFYPWGEVPRRFAYTIWIQIKTKIFRGDWRAFIAILQAFFDLLINSSRLLKNANRLTDKEFRAYSKLPESKLYWKPNDFSD